MKSSANNTKDVLFELIFLLCIPSKLLNYLMIKDKSSELFELNHKLEKFQTKCRISQLNIQIISKFSVCFSVFVTFITIEIYFWETTDSELFEKLNENFEFSPIPSRLQIFILIFY